MSFQGKKNVYVCTECGYHTITVDKDEGTTPFMMQCRNPFKCTGWARSAFYRVDQDLTPTHEWYKPDDQEITQIKKPVVLEHVKMGGLLIREIEHAIQESGPEQIQESKRPHLYEEASGFVPRNEGFQKETQEKTKKEVMFSGEKTGQKGQEG